MTQRENLLALLRRQPYEFVPAEFMLCPSLIEDYRREKTSPKCPMRTISSCPGGGWATLCPTTPT
ncbi:hypothetical protein [Candidatus Allofournierella merdipullorum]|uniref:hypothetical protein n=1 Tax=Candidatus Allofournierella merdipullorum TaxID=2838595 RepID=UPI003AB40A2E